MPGTSYAIRNNQFFEANSSRQNIRLVGPSAQIEFEDTDRTDPDGRWRWTMDDSGAAFEAASAALWAASYKAMNFVRSSVTGGITTHLGASASAYNPNAALIIENHNRNISGGPSIAELGRLLNEIVLTANLGTLDTVTIGRIAYDFDGTPRTVTTATSLRIEGAPAEGLQVTISTPLALWIDAGNSRFDGNILLDGAVVLQANSATEIGICVTNAALTVGSLGSLIIPVRTTADNVDGTDAEIGDVNGAIYFNTNNTSLGVRTGTDTTVNVGLAGYIIQNRVPEVAEGDALYHPWQFLDDVDDSGRRYVDETRCAICGEGFVRGDSIALYANALMSKGRQGHDVHAIFAHQHLDLSPEFCGLEERVESLEELKEKVLRLENRVREMESQGQVG